MINPPVKGLRIEIILNFVSPDDELLTVGEGTVLVETAGRSYSELQTKVQFVAAALMDACSRGEDSA